MEITGNIFKTDLGMKELLNPTAAGRLEGAFAQPATGGFGETLEKAINSVDDRMNAADTAAAKYAAGDNIEIHTVMIAAEQARLSITLASEVRNKVLEAYQELSRSAG